MLKNYYSYFPLDRSQRYSDKQPRCSSSKPSFLYGNSFNSSVSRLFLLNKKNNSTLYLLSNVVTLQKTSLVASPGRGCQTSHASLQIACSTLPWTWVIRLSFTYRALILELQTRHSTILQRMQELTHWHIVYMESLKANPHTQTHTYPVALCWDHTRCGINISLRLK